VMHCLRGDTYVFLVSIYRGLLPDRRNRSQANP